MTPDLRLYDRNSIDFGTAEERSQLPRACFFSTDKNGRDHPVIMQRDVALPHNPQIGCVTAGGRTSSRGMPREPHIPCLHNQRSDVEYGRQFITKINSVRTEIPLS